MSEDLHRIPLSNDSWELALSPFGQDVLAGLLKVPKQVPPVYFYDEKGSRLFEEICDLPEYYLTRREEAILQRVAPEITDRLPAETHLIELGSGNSRKTRLLLAAYLNSRRTGIYHPIDISAEILADSAIALRRDFPGLQVEPVCDLYEPGFARIRSKTQESALILWLGSSIGNFTRREALGFLQDLVGDMGSGDALLIGIDLEKDPSILEPAYDDAAGVTAAFNLNLLQRINRELGGNFDLDQFKHRALYNREEGRIEMQLISQREQRIHIHGLGRDFTFSAGEPLLTEYSHKYTRDQIRRLATQSHLQQVQQWTDKDDWFSLTLFQKG